MSFWVGNLSRELSGFTPWVCPTWPTRQLPPNQPATPTNRTNPRPPTHRFQEILSEAGFDGGRPIDEPFFRSRISGRHNPEIAADLFPDWTVEKHVEFYTDKEQRFRDLAGEGGFGWGGLGDVWSGLVWDLGGRRAAR